MDVSFERLVPIAKATQARRLSDVSSWSVSAPGLPAEGLPGDRRLPTLAGSAPGELTLCFGLAFRIPIRPGSNLISPIIIA